MRLVVLGVAMIAGLVAGTGTAAAHVIAQPDTVTQGSVTEISFQVPDEEDTASTTRVEVAFPADQPIASVVPKVLPGWTVRIDRTALARPLSSDDGPVTEAVSTITWSGGRITPGTFEDFTVAVGPLPTTTNHLVFKAIQTYDNGDVVRWIDTSKPGGAEPEHPAPSVTLKAADAVVRTAAASTVEASTSSGSDSPLGLIGLVVGVAAGVLATLALRRTRGSR
jgi:uncharacterized protein YcnI